MLIKKNFLFIKANFLKLIPNFLTQNRKFDLAYIDGGHSYDTVSSDYSFLKDVPVIVFDDYYTHEDEEFLNNPDYNGIISTFNEIKGSNKYVLPSEAPTAFGGRVHLGGVISTKEKELPQDFLRVPIVVRQKDSMPQDDIHKNIIYNVEKINDFDWVKQYKTNNKHYSNNNTT